MIIKPKIRGFLCATAHPEGCAKHVEQQIEHVKTSGAIDGPKKVLVIGGSTGYGLASRIAATFGSGAATLNISFEKAPTERKTASPGWYNTAAFERFAKAEGFYAKSLIGDAFSKEMKEAAIKTIKEDLGQVDMVVYSVAAPRRTDHEGTVWQSVLKPVGSTYTNKTINLGTGQLEEVSIEPAAEEEIAGTIKVMGGEDWRLWIEALEDAGVLADGAVTVAYSYVGPKLTHAIYRAGTIGKAKEDLERTARELDAKLSSKGGHAYVAINKALVTQASSAIPVIPLYIVILSKLLREKGQEEGCIEQIQRLFKEKLFIESPAVDETGRLRVDDYEMADEIQSRIDSIWNSISDENLKEHVDMQLYWDDFYKLFGFGLEGVDYEAETSSMVDIDGVVML